MAESLMLDYLEEGQFRQDGRDHLMACYRTLGRCGSDHSVGFLEDVLLGNAYKDRFGAKLPLHKEGAALALREIGTPGAHQILKKASRSFSAKVRQAARQALEHAK
jgi:HEAT repeat protein